MVYDVHNDETLTTLIDAYDKLLTTLAAQDQNREDLVAQTEADKAALTPVDARIETLTADIAKAHDELHAVKRRINSVPPDPNDPMAVPDEQVEAWRKQARDLTDTIAQDEADLETARTERDGLADSLQAALDALAKHDENRNKTRSGIRDCFAGFLECYDRYDNSAARQLNATGAISGAQGNAGTLGDSQDIPSEGTLMFGHAGAQGNPNDLGLSKIDRLRISSPELEFRIQALLDHLTARRIAEEMDTQTYLFRLNAFMSRAAIQAESIRQGAITALITALGVPETSQGETVQLDLSLYHSLNQIHTKIAHQIEQAPSDTFKTDQEKALVDNTAQHAALKGHLERINKATLATGGRLEALEDRMSSKDTKRRVSSIVASVSRAIEKATLVRIWPAATAVGGTIAAKVALSTKSAVFLADYTNAILLAVFIITYGASLVLGRRFRNKIMVKVRDNAYANMGALLGIGENSDKDTHFECGWIPFSALQPETRIKLNDLKPAAKLTSPLKIRMIAGNVGWVFVPALVAYLVFWGILVDLPKLLSDFPESKISSFAYEVSAKTLIGRDARGGKCRLARGHLVHKDTTHHYVEDKDETFTSVARFFFPYVYAQLIPNGHIYEIQSQVSGNINKDEADLEDCRVVVAKPDTAPEEGDTGVARLIAQQQAVLDILVRLVTACDDPAGACGGVPGIEERTQLQQQVSDLRAKAAAELRALQALAAGQVEVHRVLQEMSADRPQTWNAVFVTLEGATPPAAPDTIWNLHLYVEDTQVADLKNMLLLPFFPGPIKGTDLKPDNAFKKGLNGLADPLVPQKAAHGGASEVSRRQGGAAGATATEARIDDRDTFLKVVAQAIRDAVDADPTAMFELEVLGFASIKWDHKADDTDTNHLNHALAEGRRVAVIAALQKALEDHGADRVVLKTRHGKPPACLSTWRAPDDLAALTAKGFDSFDAMETQRKVLVAELGAESGPLDEFLKRSVGVRIMPFEGACARSEG